MSIETFNAICIAVSVFGIGFALGMLVERGRQIKELKRQK